MIDKDAWLREQERVEEQEKNRIKEFGFGFLLQEIDDALARFAAQDFIGGGSKLGELRQIIIQNENYFEGAE